MMQPTIPTNKNDVGSEVLDPEVTLIQKAKQGCVESITSLVSRYQVELRYFLLRRSGDYSVVDDLAQDVFIAAIRSLDSLKDNQSFRGWLLTIARNKVVDHLRKTSREREGFKSLVKVTVARGCTSRIHQSNLSETEALRNALQACIKKLNRNSQQLVKEFYFLDNSAQSIAISRNQKSGTIRMSLLRIRKVLAACIRKNSEIEL